MSVVDQPLVGNLDDFQDGVQESLNGNVEMASDSSPILPSKEGRVFKKAKRLVKMSPKKEDGEDEGMTVPIHGLNQNGNRAPFAKHSRKSRNAKGRGLAKKGVYGSSPHVICVS